MERFSRGSSFGPVSPHERRSADRFYSDLTGGRRTRPSASPEAYGVEASDLEAADIEALDESYFEAPDPAPPPLKVLSGQDDHEIIVVRADGTRFRVRQIQRTKIVKTLAERTRAGWCWNDKRAFLRATWCAGTQGTLDIGANVPQAARDLLTKVYSQISNDDLDQVKQTIENAPMQAFLELSVLKEDAWTFTGDVKLEMNRTGVLSKSAQISGENSWGKIGVELSDDGTGKKVMVKVEVPLSKRQVKGRVCREQKVIGWWDVQCLKEVPTVNELPPLKGHAVLKESLFLYFDYMSDRLRRDPKPAAKPADELQELLDNEAKGGTATLNQRNLERLDYLIGRGYWLQSVQGFASPEGLLKVAGKLSESCEDWRGNTTLSECRAKKARALILERYRAHLTMRRRHPEMRFPTKGYVPPATGESETPKVDDRVDGAALERLIILGDKKREIPPFLEAQPDELRRMTADDRQFVTDGRKSMHDRAERVYQNLRRVEVHLRKYEPLKDRVRPGIEFQTVSPCPDDLIEAAERHWGSRFSKPSADPPLCS